MLELTLFVAIILITAIIALFLLYQKRWYLGIGILLVLSIVLTSLFFVTSKSLSILLVLLFLALPIFAIVCLFKRIPYLDREQNRNETLFVSS